jgi:galactose mutarotase-like enzyme
MWQGGEWWKDRCPVLFPTCGNLPGRKYYYAGAEYKLPIHGIVMYREFSLVEKSDTRLLFSQKSDEETFKSYPFSFELQVEFTLDGNSLVTKLIPINAGEGIMPYMVGWHPGFNLFGEGEINNFSLKFNAGDELWLHPILPGCFVQQKGESYAAPGGTYVLNEEEIYTNDTVIFSGTGGKAILSSPDTERRIEMSYSDNLPYFCIWKAPVSSARYICLEPWSGVPTDGTEAENFDTREMLRLEGGKEATFNYDVLFIPAM